MSSPIQTEIVALIIELRNRRATVVNFSRFRAAVEDHIGPVCRRFSLRWLVSVLDTYADHGLPGERQAALMVSTLVNMLRFAETVRYVRPEIDARRLELARGNPVPLYDELNTFSIDRQDTFLNLSKRIHRETEVYPHLNMIFDEILRRVASQDTAVAEFRKISKMPERYFPVDYRQKDNHGKG